MSKRDKRPPRQFKPTGRKRMRDAKVASRALANKRQIYSAMAPRVGSMSRRRALAIVNTRTAGFLGLEKKFFDTALEATAIGSSATCASGEVDPTLPAVAGTMISTPAQGDGPSDRDGKRIVIKSVQIKGQVYVPQQELQANPAQPCSMFVALVLDTQSNGATLNSEDVFINTTAQAPACIIPNRNLLYGSRFKVLKSDLFDCNLSALSHVAADSFSFNGRDLTFDWFLPLDLPVNFKDATTGVISNVSDNSLHMIAFVTNTAPGATLAYNARIRFMG